MILSLDLLFNSFFYLNGEFFLMLICFLIFSTGSRKDLKIQILFFVLTCLIFRFLFYRTFVLDYKEIGMGVICKENFWLKFIICLSACLKIAIMIYRHSLERPKIIKSNLTKSFCAWLIFVILFFNRSFFISLINGYQPYGSRIYVFNSFFIFYYLLLFLLAIIIPVHILRK